MMANTKRIDREIGKKPRHRVIVAIQYYVHGENEVLSSSVERSNNNILILFHARFLYMYYSYQWRRSAQGSIRVVQLPLTQSFCINLWHLCGIFLTAFWFKHLSGFLLQNAVRSKCVNCVRRSCQAPSWVSNTCQLDPPLTALAF